MRSGGDSRGAGLLLALATFACMVIGPRTIGFIPVTVVGSLIFFLGIDMVHSAVFESYRKTNLLEWGTIVIMGLTMGFYDFVAGILTGVVLACVSLVLQTSRVSAVRSTLFGDVARSTVRRHPTQRHFMDQVARQIHVIKLAGFLFVSRGKPSHWGLTDRTHSLEQLLEPRTRYANW